MPDWLQKQLQNAFLEKNRHQIRLLNQCWYYYHRRYEPENIGRKHTK
ncbi:cortex morphogenetic protein CmpA [Anaerobacillus sp. CMMVII]|nr:cortex morphogenetic protein CmpA [Anaerobacillus sp. CMMVII]MCT8136579.1 cortex morphogenetic protein CmpA [Anaerobacillus sp. CMMVII]